MRTDPRNITAGHRIPNENYCDQPYVVVTRDGHWLCTLTTGRGHEGQGRSAGRTGFPPWIARPLARTRDDIASSKTRHYSRPLRSGPSPMAACSRETPAVRCLETVFQLVVVTRFLVQRDGAAGFLVFLFG